MKKGLDSFEQGTEVPAGINALASRQQRTSEALADVDAGRVIDHQAVQEWAGSLGSTDPLPVPRART